jgi:TRAP-type mannitol/chloroaromatic compound transport system permease large subunit
MNSISTSDIFMGAMVFVTVCISLLVLKTAFAEPGDKNG